MYTDSHCHINADAFAADREEVVLRARQNGIKYILDVCDDISDARHIIDFCRNHPQIYTTIGLHPEYADKYPHLSISDLLEYTNSPYVVGIGECGLDYYYNADIKEQQLKTLQIHIEAAQQSGLPLIIHNRDADEDMLEILQKNYAQHPFRGELHCFSSSEKLCKGALEIGFYISASGIITFKKSEELRQIFRHTPNERLLIETDSPYLAPVPQRGKRNEPSFVIHTAKVLAEIKEISLDELAKITQQNFLDLFNKIKLDETF